MKNKLFILIVFFGLFSCNEDFLDLKNPEADDSATYFTSAETITQSVNAIYQVLSNEQMFARKWFFIFDILSHEGAVRPNAGSEFQQLAFGAYDGTNGPIEGLWTMFYRMVTRSNFAISKLEAWEPTLEDEIKLKKRLTGEALFFRGFAYYYLATLWGDVPLRTDYESTTANTNAAREPQADVYAFAETALISASEMLPGRHEAEIDNGRATSYAALTFLGRVYAQQGMYEKALPAFKEVVDKGGYEAWDGVEGFERQFSKENRTSPESIFDVKFFRAGNGNEWFIFWGGDETAGAIGTTSARAFEYSFANDWYNVVVSPAAVEKFVYDIGAVDNYVDPRAFASFYGDNGFGGDEYYFSETEGVDGNFYDFEERQLYSWKKFNELEYMKLLAPDSEVSNQVARLRGVELMLAESYIMSGNIPGALTHINNVRREVGAIEYETLPGDLDAAMQILKRERELELLGEQQRWFDLVRWDKNWPGFDMIELLNNEKIASGVPGQANFQDKHVLFPIPATEKNVNFLLEVPNGWN